MKKHEAQALPYLFAHMYSGCCTPWPFTSRRGYGDVWFDNRRIGRAHVMVCTMINGPKPTPQHHARHLCGKGHLGCFNAFCLKWGTARENAADTVRHGTTLKGETNGAAKLTEVAVRDIRARRGLVSQFVLADEYGVSQGLISLVQLRKVWPHV